MIVVNLPAGSYERTRLRNQVGGARRGSGVDARTLVPSSSGQYRREPMVYMAHFGCRRNCTSVGLTYMAAKVKNKGLSWLVVDTSYFAVWRKEGP